MNSLEKDSKKILIVDDEVELVKLYSEFLEGSFPGCKIFQAYDGQKGLELLNGVKVDLIISDFKMPKMNGGEMVSRLRKEIPGGDKIQVLMISGFREDALVAGVDNDEFLYFLDKPLDLTKLIKVLRLRMGW